MQFIDSQIKFLTNYFFKSPKDKEAIIPQEYKSHDYERKLALIVKNTDTVNLQDLKYVVITKLDTRDKSDLFSAFRLDFHTRDQLKKFKKKYKSLLL
mgnify:CR=1 FL=1